MVIFDRKQPQENTVLFKKLLRFYSMLLVKSCLIELILNSKMS